MLCCSARAVAGVRSLRRLRAASAGTRLAADLPLVVLGEVGDPAGFTGYLTCRGDVAPRMAHRFAQWLNA